MRKPTSALPDTRHLLTLTAERLSTLSPLDQRRVMEDWFRSQYDRPDLNTPYDKEDGRYVWLWGGPFDPREELQKRFGGLVAQEVITPLADELVEEYPEWAPTEDNEDYETYDDALLDGLTSSADPFPMFTEAIATTSRLLAVEQPDPTLLSATHRLLFANVIFAIEAYLAETFTRHVLADKSLLRRHVESVPEFSKQTLAYSDVFKAADEVTDEVKRRLLDVVWHRMAKVRNMYASTLGITIDSHLGPIARAVDRRHHIVHRNGRDRDGKSVEVSAEDVRALLLDAQAFVGDIEHQRRYHTPPTL